MIIELDLEVEGQDELDALLAYFKALGQAEHWVEIGLYGEKTASIGAAVEFGTQNSPPRPLFAWTFDENVDEMFEAATVMFGQSLNTGRRTGNYLPPKLVLKWMVDSMAEVYDTKLREMVFEKQPFAPNKERPYDSPLPWVGPEGVNRALAEIERDHILNLIKTKHKIKTKTWKLKPLKPTKSVLKSKGRRPTKNNYFSDALKGISQASKSPTRGRGRGSSSNALKGLSRTLLRYAGPDTQIMAFKKSSSKKRTRTRFTPKGNKGRRYPYNRPRF